jgi:hypothetical protein
MTHRHAWFLIAAASGLLVGRSAAVDGLPEDPDERTVAAARVGLDGPALLDFFRKRTLSDADQERLATTVRRLGADSFQARQKASAELIAAGRLALPFLRAAVKDPDAEISLRAERCLKQIEGGEDNHVASAAVRLLARRKPPQTIRVLLAYLPFAGNEDVAGEVQTTLNAVAWRDGKPAEVLVKALTDKLVVKRAAAAEALIHSSPANRRAEFRKLLKDPEPLVRLHAAQAFIAVRDKEAIPVLIALVAELPRQQAGEAEEVLYRLAGEDAPTLVQGKDVTPAKVSAAWADWWRRHGDRIDLAKLDAEQRLLGFTLVVVNGSRMGGDQVQEFGPDGKVRWQISNLQVPRDAQVVSGNRVLIAEENGGRVTERNFKGEVLWEKKVASPIACKRLPNGHTFIGTRTHMLVVDRGGKELSSVRCPNNQTFATAIRLPNGQLAGILSDYVTLKRFDASGKELKSFAVDFYSIIGNIEVLPNRRLLLPEYRRNRIAEYDLDGKLIRQVSIQQPTAVVRLRNGNLLVSSWTRRWMGEIDRNGKVVKEQALDGMPCRVRRR